MNEFRLIQWKNRMISIFPCLSLLSEIWHVLRVSGIWRSEGWVVPPPYFVRRAMLLAEARAIGAQTLVETGTYHGDTAWSFRSKFRRIHTIEVEPTLAALARERFRRIPTVVTHEGDSAALLAGICEGMEGACVFFLDGHYSGGNTGMGQKECPVLEELDAIFSHARHPFRVVIDDARLFGTVPAYPSLGDIDRFLSSRGRSMRVENDAIVI